MTENSTYASFWEHVEDLRRTFLRMLAVAGLGILISFCCYGPIISFLTSPLTNTSAKMQDSVITERLEHMRLVNHGRLAHTYHPATKDNSVLESSPDVEVIAPNTYRLPSGAWLIYTQPVKNTPLVVLGPLEGMLIAFKTSFWVGLVGSSPLWLLVLLQFIAPALHGHEKRLIAPFLVTSLLFVLAGGLFAFLVTIPIANEYLSAFNQSIGTNLWSLARYLDYSLFLILANGLAFELCAMGLFAVHLGLLTAEGLSSQRRLAIVLAFIVGAILTPPDVLTQLMLAIPLIVLYEGVILYARLKSYRQAKSRHMQDG